MSTEASPQSNEKMSRRERLLALAFLVFTISGATSFTFGLSEAIKRSEKQVAAADARSNRGWPSLLPQYKERELSTLGRHAVHVEVDPQEIVAAKRLLLPEAEFKASKNLPKDRFPKAYREIALVNKILEPSQEIKTIRLEPVAENPSYGAEIVVNGYADNDKSAVSIEIMPGHTFEDEEIHRLVFHESMHYFSHHVKSWPKVEKDYNGLKRDWEETNDLMFRIMEEEGVDDISFLNAVYGSADPLHDEKLGPLFALVDESSYYGSMGHPYSDSGELFASTLSVLHFYPNSFITSVNVLSENDQLLLKRTARDCINILYNNSASSTGVDELFSAELRDYIGITK